LLVVQAIDRRVVGRGEANEEVSVAAGYLI